MRQQNDFFRDQILIEEISMESNVVFSPATSFSSSRKALGALNLIRSYRKTRPTESINLSGAVLRGANFESNDLSNTVFVGADLRGVKFRHCNLSGVVFTDCDFSPFEITIGTQTRKLYPNLRDTNVTPQSEARRQQRLASL